MKYKTREKIPIYGTILMILGCVLILGIFPCIPLCFWVHYNNQYVLAFEKEDEALLEKYTRYMKRAKTAMIIVTILSIVLDVFLVTQTVLTILDKYNTDCIPCSMRG